MGISIEQDVGLPVFPAQAAPSDFVDMVTSSYDASKMSLKRNAYSTMLDGLPEDQRGELQVFLDKYDMSPVQNAFMAEADPVAARAEYEADDDAYRYKWAYNRLKEKYPDAETRFAGIPTPEKFNASALDLSKMSQEDAERAARFNISSHDTIAGLAGGGGAFFTEPETIASMLPGMLLSNTVSKGATVWQAFWRMAGIEAVAGGAAEVSLIGEEMDWRKEMGTPITWGEAGLRMSLATVGAGLVGGAAEGIARKFAIKREATQLDAFNKIMGKEYEKAIAENRIADANEIKQAIQAANHTADNIHTPNVIDVPEAKAAVREAGEPTPAQLADSNDALLDMMDALASGEVRDFDYKAGRPIAELVAHKNTAHDRIADELLGRGGKITNDDIDNAVQELLASDARKQAYAELEAKANTAIRRADEAIEEAKLAKDAGKIDEARAQTIIETANKAKREIVDALKEAKPSSKKASKKAIELARKHVKQAIKQKKEVAKEVDAPSAKTSEQVLEDTGHLPRNEPSVSEAELKSSLETERFLDDITEPVEFIDDETGETIIMSGQDLKQAIEATRSCMI